MMQAVKSLEPFLLETAAPVLASVRQMFDILESRYHQAGVLEPPNSAIFGMAWPSWTLISH